MAKTKTVKKKTKPRKRKRMSRGVELPWEVWSLDNVGRMVPHEFHVLFAERKSEAKAKKCLKDNPGLIAPVIRHVEIPPMEY